MNEIEIFQTALRRIRIETENGADRITDEGILSQTEDGVPIRKLFIGNIAERTTYKDLSTLFSKYGVIESCYLKRNPGKRNFAFITFSTIEGAIKARRDGSIKEINLHDRDLRVMPANSWYQPDSIKSRSYIFTKDWNKSHKKTSVEEDNLDYTENYSDGPIRSLNDDCLMHIFHYLPIISKISIERVCKRWRAVSQESWSTVKKLDLSCHTWGTLQMSNLICTANLREVLIRCGRFLTHLDFSQSGHYLNRTTLLLISKFCPNLQIIDITALDVTASGIGSLARNCKNIKKLSLGYTSYNHLPPDKDLVNLFVTNKSLNCLNLSASKISGLCLLYLPSDTLEELVLNNCESIKSSYLIDALTILENLKSLTIKNCTCSTSHVMKAIGNCTNLETLKLESFDMDVDVGLEISRLVNLTFLRLRTTLFVKDELLISLASECKQLTYLDISGCDYVTDTGLEAIATLPKLETLLINCLDQITAIGLDNMYNLKYLECRQCTLINDMGLAILIHGSTNLKLLDLSGCIGITNATINVAIDATSSRSNNTILKIFVGGTSVKCDEIDRTSPYLLIVNLDLSSYLISSSTIL